MIGMTWGSTMWALKRTTSQPWPKGKRSSWMFSRPHSSNLAMVQSLACSICGDPVSRGPEAVDNGARRGYKRAHVHTR